MGIHMPPIVQAKQLLRWPSLTTKNAASTSQDVGKGYFAVDVGEQETKRFVVPISYLNQPAFQDLLSLAEKEFGFDHLAGCLRIPCREDVFMDLPSRLS